MDGLVARPMFTLQQGNPKMARELEQWAVQTEAGLEGLEKQGAVAGSGPEAILARVPLLVYEH